MRVSFSTAAAFLITTFLLLATSTALPIAQFDLPFPLPLPLPIDIPLPPDIDPFYIPPFGFESTASGTILRTRRIQAALFGFVPQPVESYQLLYRTTAINGSAIATVVTIFKPTGSNFHNDRFISFQTAYDSAAPRCEPSYTQQFGVIQQNLVSDVETLLLEVFLISGYIVAQPDYEGPEAAFIPGHLEGMVSLDGMRAVSDFAKELGMSTLSPPKVAAYGYSGGGQATAWAAALQPSYAPELNVVGFVNGGVPVNLTAEVLYTDDTIFSGFLPDAIAGLSKPSAYGAILQPLLDRLLTPYGRSIVDFANQNCGMDDLLVFAEQSIFSYDFQIDGPRLLDEPVIRQVLGDNILGVNGNEVPMKPILMYHATLDEIIPYGPAIDTFRSWCEQGASSILFLTYESGGHATTEFVAFTEAFQFIENAFDGNLALGCANEVKYDMTVDPLALGLDLEPVLIAIINAIAKLGQDDAVLKDNLAVLKDGVPT